MSRSVALVRQSRQSPAIGARPSYYALNVISGATPPPGGVPAHQPVPEVPAREHPLPSPQEVPVSPPSEVPVEVPSTPGPAA